jgi:hypothetical protein
MSLGIIDLKGRKFGKLTVTSRSGLSRDGHATWACRCDCGSTRTFTSRALRKGQATSCGCGSQNRWWTDPERVAIRHRHSFCA